MDVDRYPTLLLRELVLLDDCLATSVIGGIGYDCEGFLVAGAGFFLTSRGTFVAVGEKVDDVRVFLSLGALETLPRKH